MSEAGSSSNCAFTFKKRVRGGARGGGGGMRKRKDDSSASSSSEDETTVVRNVRNTASNPLVQKSGGFKKFKKAGDSDSDSDSAPKSVTSIKYESKGAVIEKNDQNATAVRKLDADEANDQRTINDRKEQIHNETKGKADDKVYRGINNYAQYIDKRESLIGKRLHIKGPIRAPANIRTTVRWDYEPMICKDYKETGFCGFGDSCKFMHDRADYKFGWQLEREEREAEKRDGEEESDDDKYVINSDDDDDLPVKCPMCRQVFTNPVVTRCKCYFCEKCALDHYRKSQRCYECGKQTNGMFNPAKDLIERMAKREAAGKTYSSDSEDDERLPDESEKKAIPEDDPDYYSKVHDPYEDDHRAHESY